MGRVKSEILDGFCSPLSRKGNLHQTKYSLALNLQNILSLAIRLKLEIECVIDEEKGQKKCQKFIFLKK
ncbi:hypothetical protein F511_47759 [Dorcoceras hygrometricum]|uniref:Uncharacterized protein n=1 Tax=Dorcoceras hygrometricum TaxID=472368 RepID=A0A2Z6ZQC9_9LAMI|nr:hypothetical protein F511_47759 [Dorcoceras hygrometricum]